MSQELTPFIFVKLLYDPLITFIILYIEHPIILYSLEIGIDAIPSLEREDDSPSILD